MTAALTAAAEALYADLPYDTREIVAKANPDTADVSGGGAAAKAKRERTQARVGLASNVVGIAAGTAGLKEVAGRDAFKEGGRAGRAVYRAGQAAGKVPGLSQAGAAIARHPKAAAAGALGLQAANLAGDAVSNRVLARGAKQGEVKKGVVRLPTNKMPLVHANARARRLGLRPGPSGVSKGLVVEEISKAPWTKLADAGHMAGFTPAKGAKLVDPSLHESPTAGIGRSAPAQPRDARRAYTGQRRVESGPRVSRGLAITGAATGVTGAGVGGFEAGRRQPSGLAKSDGDVGRFGQICKVDEDKRQIFAWASIHSLADGTVVCDLQGDIVPVEEIEKSAYTYMLDSRVGGHMHLRKSAGTAVHVADVIESLVVTPEKEAALGLPPNSLPYGWWLGMQVNDDEVWGKVKSGEITGLSIHGSGIRKAVQ